MRLLQVAKALGMTGQQLRKELTIVDFGVKPTDREVPDGLAQGILRYLARKYNVNVDTDILAVPADVEEETAAPVASPESAQATMASETAATSPAQTAARSAAPVHGDHLHVLRKLTLEGVSKDAIARQVQESKPLTKAEREAKAQEERAMTGRKRRGEAEPQTNQEQIKRKEGTVLLPQDVMVKELAEKLGVQVPKIIATLLKNGVMATVNQSIDYDAAAIVAQELGIAVSKEQASAKVEDLVSRNLAELLKDDPENLTERPPIVVVMGHVDHGKTSILDAIRQTNVVEGESGGITQHIGAYQVLHQGRPVTFLDTPGHQAFTAMRARGAKLTDIAILVVSAEEGVKETTVEAINHAKDANVPILVAINKIDRPAANPEKVKGELAAHGLQTEEWGGQTPTVMCSALTKQGIPELLDHVLLLAELQKLTANPRRRAVATVIESALDSSHGPLGTVVVNTGTLQIGDAFICGKTLGKVRVMMNDRGERAESALPSGAVRVSGFDAVPMAGDVLQVVESERMARDLHEEVMQQHGQQTRKGFADFMSRLHEGKVRQLKVIVKADAQGSLEAIERSLEQQRTEELTVKVIHGGVGAVTESDVLMASASEALVIAFRVPVPPAVQRAAERDGVKIREYDVIYTLLDEVGSLLQGLLEPEEEEKILGHLEVKGVFFRKKDEQIVGGKVQDGTLKRVLIRIQRGGQMIGTGRITSLRRADKDIKEAKEGSECGMRIESAMLVEVGDILEVYAKEFRKKEI